MFHQRLVVANIHGVDISIIACFSVEVDGTNTLRHPFRSLVIGGGGAFVPFPSHSFVTYLGPQVYMLLLDCRLVRSLIDLG